MLDYLPQDATPTPATGGGHPLDPMLKADEVCRLLGIGASTLWKWVAEGNFPPPVRLSNKCSRWRACDVHRFIDERGRGGVA